jgi:multidrug efflux pump subunit AcrA (membrane-fusion protein)
VTRSEAGDAAVPWHAPVSLCVTSGLRCAASTQALVLVLLLAVGVGLSGCGDKSARAAAASRLAPGAPAAAATASGAGAAAGSSGAAGTAGRVVAVARGSVEVPGGLFELLAPQDGLVDSVAVAEGAAVQRGQPLLQLGTEAARSDIATAQAELALARARQRAQGARLPAARQLAQRLAEAARAEAVDAQRADDAAQAVRELESLQPVATAEVALAAQKLTQAQAALRRLTLRAPIDGSVLRLQVQPGSRVSAQGGRALLVLLPARPLAVRAEVNEAFVGHVKVGMRATLHLDGDGAAEAQRAGTALPGARVVRIAPVFGSGRLDDDAQLRGGGRVVECFLEFDQPPALRVGQSLRVEIHE